MLNLESSKNRAAVVSGIKHVWTTGNWEQVERLSIRRDTCPFCGASRDMIFAIADDDGLSAYIGLYQKDNIRYSEEPPCLNSDSFIIYE